MSSNADGPAARLLALAFYLPQFHRVAENDAWWEPGFTEWTHMRRARPWFAGHQVRQPIPPLGHYDLLDPAVMEAQYQLASSHGIDGFLVWDYWLGGGRRLLDRPLQSVLQNQLHFRYAIAWANHSWVDQLRRRTLAEQLYLGSDDYAAYFAQCLPHFRSNNYIRVDGKPLFFVYRPEQIPDIDVFIETWQRLARTNGLPGLYLVGDRYKWASRISDQFDAKSCGFGFFTNRKKLLLNLVKENLRRRFGVHTSPQRFDFSTMLRDYLKAPRPEPDLVPTVLTGWDTTPRHGRNGVVFAGLDENSFRSHLEAAGESLLKQKSLTRLLFVKSWNEWAEGNLLEPDSVHGDRLLTTFGAFAAGLRERLANSSTAQPAAVPAAIQ